MSRMLTALLLSLICATAASAAPATQPVKPLKPGDHKRVIDHDGWQRSYFVHVPPKYDPKSPTPVVLAFHGAMMNGGGMNQFSGLTRKADDANFVVVYPNGTGLGETILFFNASAKPSGVPGESPPDDVGFTAALLDDLETVINVDKKRVYATGMSNGGMMSHRLAAELSDRIAAVAPVAGTLAVSDVKPKRPVPVMHFHGMDDKIVPYEGPRGGRTPKTMQFKSVEETIRVWREVNGCAADPKVTKVEDTAGDGMPGTIKTYGGGKDGAEVVLVTIDNAGHTWPGREPIVGFIGKSGKNVIANDLMWEFFKKHPMK